MFGDYNLDDERTINTFTSKLKEAAKSLNDSPQFKRIVERQEVIKRGGLISYPFNFGYLNKVLPGMLIDNMIISGSTSSGKSSITKFFHLQRAIDTAISNNLDYHCIYFALEDTKETIEDMLLCYVYYKTYKKVIDFKLLSGMRKTDDSDTMILTDNQLAEINAIIPAFNLYLERITIIDNAYSPDEIKNRTLECASQWGQFFKAKAEYVKQMLDAGEQEALTEQYNYVMNRYVSIEDLKENGYIGTVLENVPIEYVKNDLFDVFKLYNKFKFVSVVIDNVDLLSDKNLTLTECISQMSKSVGKKCIVKKLGFSYTLIQQQAKERTNSDNLKADTWLPNDNGLSMNKSTGNDSRLSLGISNPYKLGLNKFQGYELAGQQGMRDYFRVLNVFKNTYGSTGAVVPLFTIPQVNDFFILPKIKKDETINPLVEEKILKLFQQIQYYESNLEYYDFISRSKKDNKGSMSYKEIKNGKKSELFLDNFVNNVASLNSEEFEIDSELNDV